MITKSIRWRLLTWLALMLGGLVAGFAVTAYQLARLDRLRGTDEALERRVGALAADVRGTWGGPRWNGTGPRPPFDGGPPEPRSRNEDGGPLREPPPDFDGPRMEKTPGDNSGGWLRRPPGEPPALMKPREFKPSTETLALFDEKSPELPYFIYWSREGTETKSALAPAERPRPAASDADSRIHVRLRDGVREAYFFTERGDCVLAGVSTLELTEDLRRLGWWLTVAGVVVIAVGVGGGWLLVNAALRPVEKIGATAGRIANGALSERIDMAETESELGRLAQVLNATFARLESAFAEQRRFTADASHEIRTPLAVIISEAQATLTRERDAAEYRETVEICLEAAQQIRRLADSLLELARFDAGGETMRREPVDLADVAGHAASLLAPLGRERGIEIELSLQAADCQGDADRLQQVARNLIDNAIYYNVDGGRVSVCTESDAYAVRLLVTDTGRGIAAEDLPHVFRRFYRADKARSRAGGRSGLGLAICRAIVEAHGGEISVASELGKGTTFVVSLPPRSASVD